MDPYPVRFAVDYPDRELDRVTSFFRIFTVIPILIVVGALVGYSTGYSEPGEGSVNIVVAGVGLIFLPVLLMVVFRGRYPRWWFDWNLQLLRFLNRVVAYALLMDDHYPSTEDQQAVHLEFPYPDAGEDLDRGLPLVKWLLAIPHYFMLLLLDVGVVIACVIAWFSILFTGHYPRSLFDYVEGVIRWHNRVIGYAFILVTDRYPPFRLGN